MFRRNAWLIMAIVLLLPVSVPEAEGAPLVRTPARGPIIATGAERRMIKSTPIVQRQNRMFHVYGNTIRRISRVRRR